MRGAGDEAPRRGLAGREEGLQLTAQAQHLAFGIRKMPPGRGLEGDHEALHRVAGGAHDGRAVAMIDFQSQGRHQEAEAILEEGLR